MHTRNYCDGKMKNRKFIDRKGVSSHNRSSCRSLYRHIWGMSCQTLQNDEILQVEADVSLGRKEGYCEEDFDCG